ncbi:hypothetical protein L1787_18525 [Acuticoccus sp. M5D2P5]|uniref:hypothetical protein n=1 Tax=Acuticoccus kalidii TaxID=2910977 RepID=UPI001F17D679|nr:hypothetical protein [Acuticoccus kalidii]MCF3935389.1 hypothetical protein [Acuticoccus kalidii]
MLVFQVNTAAPEGADILVEDDLLKGANNGVPWLVHMGWQGSYGGETPVPDGAVVSNMAGPDNSSVAVPFGQPIIAGGGLDFSTVDRSGTYLTIPPSVSTAIADAGQEFLVCLYLKLPLESEWAQIAGQARTIFYFCDSGNYLTMPDILTIRLTGSGGVEQILAHRQTALGEFNALLAMSPLDPAAHGEVAQLAFWRDGEKEYFSMKTTPTGRITRSAAAGVDNFNAISGLTGKIGLTPTWPSPLSGQDLETRKFRFYRGFVEIPSVSGRDPLAVLDEDWSRNIAEFG